MPETVASAIASAVFAAGGTITATQAAVAAYAVIATTSVAAGQAQRRKALRQARDAVNARLQDRLVMQSTVSGARSRVYGRVRTVDGILYKGTHGADKRYYTMVVALAGHEIDAVEEVWFDDAPVTLDGDGYVTSAPWARVDSAAQQAALVVTGAGGSVVLPHAPVAGSVMAVRRVGEAGESQDVDITGALSVSGATVSVPPGTEPGTYVVTYQRTTAQPRARVRAFLGAPGQDLYPTLSALLPGVFLPTDRFAGVACLLVTLEFDPDVYPSGLPNVSAVIRGAKVLDPRTAGTAWTENPALIARDWSLYAHGGGCAEAEINGPTFTAAASACDVSTVFALAGGGSETRPLYQCGIVIPLDGHPDEALDEICESMAGQWSWAGGRLAVRAGAWRTPVAEIGESWLGGQADITIVPETPTAELVNVSRPQFADAGQGWVTTPGPEVPAAAYIEADGRELPREVPLGGVTRAVHAQHACAVLMRENREGGTLKLPCNLLAWQLEVFDVVSVTLPVFGYAAKTFEVQGWEFSAFGGVVLTLRETAPGIYTPDATFAVATVSPNTNLPRPQAVPQLQGLAAESGTVALSDGTVVSRVRLTWTPVSAAAVTQGGSVEVQYAEGAVTLPTGDWPAVPPVDGNAIQSAAIGLRIGTGYVFRARFVSALGVRGPWSRLLLHVVAGLRTTRNAIYRQAAAPSAGTPGDLWIDTDDGNRLYVREGSAWVDVRDGGIAAALDAAADAQATADGKIDTYWQAAPPSGPGIAEGDLWFDTDDGARQYRRTGGSWVVAADTRIGQAISNAADAQATADGKVTTFVQASPPSAEGVGDLWLDTDDGNRLYRWSGAAWVPLPVGTGALAPGSATEIVVDEADLAGTTYPTGAQTVRSFTVTPPVDCVVEFTASLEAVNVNGDAGNRLGWYVTPAGGSSVLLGVQSQAGGGKVNHVCFATYWAAAGVGLTFTVVLDRGAGNPAMSAWRSYMRATLIKR